MLAAISVIAVCFAFTGVSFGSVLSTFAFFILINPHPLRWSTFEFAAASAWLLGMVLIASNLSMAWEVFLCLPTGGLLGFSWLLRQVVESDKSQSRQTWTDRAFVPLSFVLALILCTTDMDFRLRLFLSTPALCAEAQQLPRGYQRSYQSTPGSAGLFRVYEIKERDGCVFWKTGVVDWSTSEGLVYVPSGKLPQWPGNTSDGFRYRFRHIQGPWWVYTKS